MVTKLSDANLEEAINTLFTQPLPDNLASIQVEPTYLINGRIETHSSAAPVESAILSNNAPHTIGSYPLLTGEIALAALASAKAAFPTWSHTPLSERIRAARRFSKQMPSVKVQVVALEMLEVAKSRADCEKEFDRTVQYIDQTCDLLESGWGQTTRTESGITANITRTPHGVMLCMGPYNYPINESLTTIIPSIIMGNTVIAKGARMGMLAMTPLYEVMRKTFPQGVLNYINGDGQTIISPLMQSGELDAFSFIGSCNKYNDIVKQHPHLNRLATNAGLQAKNVGLVLENADMELAAKECVAGSLSYNGQRCTALKLLLVPEQKAAEFQEAYLAQFNNLTFGLPWENPNITPMPHPATIEYLSGILQDATSKGAVILNPHGGITNGTYMHPAILNKVTPEMRIFHEEQFGPIVPIVTYNKVKDAVKIIRASKFGQQASIFTTDNEMAEMITDALSTSVARININMQCQRGPDSFPFGGRSESAVGELSITAALEFASRNYVVARR